MATIQTHKVKAVTDTKESDREELERETIITALAYLVNASTGGATLRISVQELMAFQRRWVSMYLTKEPGERFLAISLEFEEEQAP